LARKHLAKDKQGLASLAKTPGRCAINSRNVKGFHTGGGIKKREVRDCARTKRQKIRKSSERECEGPVQNTMNAQKYQVKNVRSQENAGRGKKKEEGEEKSREKKSRKEG